MIRLQGALPACVERGVDARGAAPENRVRVGPGSWVPGHYVVAIKGEKWDIRRNRTVPFTRLATYTFSADGRVSEAFWYWDTTGSSAFSPSGRVVGVTDPEDGIRLPCSPGNADRNTSIYTASAFLKSPMVIEGVWEVESDAPHVRITWSNGQGSERWRLTWQDQESELYKIELFWTDYTVGGFFLRLKRGVWGRCWSGTYTTTAGWGFGSPYPAGVGKSLADYSRELEGTLHGWMARHNGDKIDQKTGRGTNEGVIDPGTVTFQLPTKPFFDDQGAMSGYRLYTASPVRTCNYCYGNEPMWVFTYWSKREGMLGRSMFYHNGHDHGGPGGIGLCDKRLYQPQDGGHVYCGLEVIDGAGALRGFVFSEMSKGAQYYASAHFEVDDVGFDAQLGVDPWRQESSVPVICD